MPGRAASLWPGGPRRAPWHTGYARRPAGRPFAHRGGVAQPVRALPCHGRGRGFESRRSRQPRSQSRPAFPAWRPACSVHRPMASAPRGGPSRQSSSRWSAHVIRGACGDGRRARCTRLCRDRGLQQASSRRSDLRSSATPTRFRCAAARCGPAERDPRGEGRSDRDGEVPFFAIDVERTTTDWADGTRGRPPCSRPRASIRSSATSRPRSSPVHHPGHVHGVRGSQ